MELWQCQLIELHFLLTLQRNLCIGDQNMRITSVFVKLGATQVQWAFLHHQAAASGRPFQLVIWQGRQIGFHNKFSAGRITEASPAASRKRQTV